MKALFDKIIGFMRRIYGALRDQNGISPELRRKFDEIFTGEAQAGRGGAQNAGGQPGTEIGRETRQEAARSAREEIINDPGVSPETKAQAVFAAAEEELYQREYADNQRVDIEVRKDRILESFRYFAEPMRVVPFSKENYERFFPNDRVQTPLGEVKIGANQYKKLENKDTGNRQQLLGAMYQTLHDPIVIVRQFREKDGGKQSLLYAKSFLKEDGGHFDIVISVVVNQTEWTNPISVAITTHKRPSKDILKVIKNPADIAYEKANTTGPDSGDHDVNSSSPEGRHSTFSLSAASPEKSSPGSENSLENTYFQTEARDLVREAASFPTAEKFDYFFRFGYTYGKI